MVGPSLAIDLHAEAGGGQKPNTMVVAMKIALCAVLSLTALVHPVCSRITRRPRPAASAYKYFTEPGQSLALSHYDSRFFHDQITYDEHHDILRHLIRSYLVTMQALGAETWLAHGTLLGWWWNAQIMPWDYDLDVQVADTTMALLAGRFNMTEYMYSGIEHDPTAADAGAERRNRTYLLDINPHYVTNGPDANNFIDGRWIDTENGMFIDITVLRERGAPGRTPGVWSCKNGHRYRAAQLWPLRVTEFEGVPARIPYAFQDILQAEYTQRALMRETWLK